MPAQRAWHEEETGYCCWGTAFNAFNSVVGLLVDSCNNKWGASNIGSITALEWDAEKVKVVYE
jgi:hypothetical protein